jgi:predicted TIM-barrel fold metal-dependent hydrolase
MIAAVVGLGTQGLWHKTSAGFPSELPASNSALSQDLQAFAALNPIDTHTHVFKNDPAFVEMLRQLHLQVVDICVVNDLTPRSKGLEPQLDNALSVVRSAKGYAWLCTTFDPYRFDQPDFSERAMQQLDKNFAEGAVAVKIWKNIGMEIKRPDGQYVMPDDPVFEGIYKDIAAHNKTLIAHLAEPDSCWQPPNPKSGDYSYYQEHPEWYMYRQPDHPSKATILAARDRMLANNPQLRVVGAHLGSMETDLDEMGRHFDHYPNFAVDTAARVHYFMLQPRDKVRAFLIKYQDRILYGTDLEVLQEDNTEKDLRSWKETYERDWTFFSTDHTVKYNGNTYQGISLPAPVLRKIFHDNAVYWIPGIMGKP